jgi:hypothetical protein
MTLKKKTPSISDKQLRQALADLREEVAAPADFRAKLMRRLESEGLVQLTASAQALEPSLWARLQGMLTPVRLSFAASLALGLVLYLRLASPTASPLAPAAGAQNAAATAPVQTAPVVAQAKPSQRVVTAAVVQMALGPKTSSSPMPEAILDEAQESGEAVVGDAPVEAPVTSNQVAVAPAFSAEGAPSTGAGLAIASAGNPGAVSAASVDPKPTVIVVEPSPTPMAVPLEGNSQLRGNVIRASRGESAVLLYRVLKAGHVHAEVFDRLGHSITVLKDAELSAGVYELKWGGQTDEGALAPSGIMVLDLRAPGYHAQHKLLLVK